MDIDDDGNLVPDLAESYGMKRVIQSIPSSSVRMRASLTERR